MPRNYFSDEDEEGEREYGARSWDKTDTTTQATKRRLPTKSQSGDVIKKPFEKRAKVDVLKGKPEEEEDGHFHDGEEELALDNDAQAELDMKEQKENEEEHDGEEEEELDEDTALMTIAQLSNSILANEPNSIRAGGVKTSADGVAKAPEPPAIERLLAMCRSAKNWNVRKAAILSLLAVLRDILPDDYVRELTEMEQKAKMTKETRLQRSLEKSLLTQYRLFLAVLFEGVRIAPWEARPAKSSLSLIRRAKLARLSIYCLCNMMEARPNFNFYEDILKTVIPRTSSPDSKTSRICVESLERAMEDDITFECALTVVKSFGKLYERKKTLSAQALAAAAKLRLSMDLKDEKRMDLIAQAKKERQKRRRKYGADLSKVLEETEVTMSKNHDIMQRQVEIIRELFTLYLRIFSDASEQEVFLKRSLTTEALKGAARLMSLVNIEFVHGLVGILSTFFHDQTKPLTHMDVALQTCETGLNAMSLLSRPELRAKTTALEDVAFTKLLLRCIANLTEDENASVYIASIMKCVSILFISRRESDAKIVADFCVRLINAAMRVPAHFALGLLSLSRRLLEKYSHAKDIVLGTSKSVEEEACGPLIPVAYSVDSVGTESRAAWELALMGSSHYHLAVKKFTHDARLNKANFNDRPMELISLHHPLDGEVFYPFVGPGMKPHKRLPEESSEQHRSKRHQDQAEPNDDHEELSRNQTERSGQRGKPSRGGRGGRSEGRGSAHSGGRTGSHNHREGSDRSRSPGRGGGRDGRSDGRSGGDSSSSNRNNRGGSRGGGFNGRSRGNGSSNWRGGRGDSARGGSGGRAGSESASSWKGGRGGSRGGGDRKSSRGGFGGKSRGRGKR